MDAPPPIPREAWEGCSVLLDINDGDRLAFFRLTPAATVKIGNKTCSLQPLVGRPFGTLFRVGADGLVPCAAADAPSRDDSMQDGADGQVQDETRDNRSLVDNNTAQNLSSDDIEAMKRDGATGDEIVEALIANSSTFGKKTVFSQEKYKLKKQKKYAPKVLLRRPSTRSICETYFKKNPARIGFMRVDTLSLLLSMANIGPYSDVLVVDMVGGLIVGAVAERLGGTGYVCSAYLGTVPSSIDIIRMYNLSSDMVSRIVQVPLIELCSMQSSGNTPYVPSGNTEREVVKPGVVQDEDAQASLAQAVDTADEKAQLSTEQTTDMEISKPSLDVQDENSSLECKGGDGDSIASKFKPGKAPSPEKMKYWNEHGFSSLIVAAPGHEVENFVADLLPLLSYSAPFAIYHQYLEPLAKCMHTLQVSKRAIGLQLSEPWLREYQLSNGHPIASSHGGKVSLSLGS
ncbi:tRNA (adenine(58)-N(1))-methyltransferase non-catalytic subunit TRM6-like isoform X2 [Panicum virgatum]|uniref:tRNA (adenine(58)-N(1))-methyltransferase non-catalytic subunit TRM6-like isoform X2 n=1 Tax=Panicum virgatum TaxID=38727 RepID=UPI0019D501F5|nr:tRNA (adenine(58)-N(1))-methyltransferase non-catalytic subunit TRM6-like isoform X2 [Panicum virgatum]